MATPSERLYARIRSAVESTPAAATRTRTRIIAALAIVPALTTLVVLVASGFVYGRPAAGLDLNVASSGAALTTLALLTGLALASTVFALWQGRSGFGIDSMWLVSIAALVVPVYAALTVLQPVHSGAADATLLTGVAISPWGLRCISSRASWAQACWQSLQSRCAERSLSRADCAVPHLVLRPALGLVSQSSLSVPPASCNICSSGTSCRSRSSRCWAESHRAVPFGHSAQISYPALGRPRIFQVCGAYSPTQ